MDYADLKRTYNIQGYVLPCHAMCLLPTWDANQHHTTVTCQADQPECVTEVSSHHAPRCVRGDPEGHLDEAALAVEAWNLSFAESEFFKMTL